MCTRGIMGSVRDLYVDTEYTGRNEEIRFPYSDNFIWAIFGYGPYLVGSSMGRVKWSFTPERESNCGVRPLSVDYYLNF